MTVTNKMAQAFNMMVKNRFIKRDTQVLQAAAKYFGDPKLEVLIEGVYQASLKVEEYLQQRCEAKAFLEKSLTSGKKSGEVKR